MPIKLDDLSRFKFSEPIIVDGKETFGRWKRPDFLDSNLVAAEDIITMTIDGRFAGRPDLIAEQIYGSAFLEWIVIMFNRPKNPLGWPKVSEVIKLPSSRVVFGNI